MSSLVRLIERTQRSLVSRAERGGRSLDHDELHRYEFLERVRLETERSDAIVARHEARLLGQALQPKPRRWSPRAWW